jgi:sugar/nucleoside kinase (ribokinase family)
MNARSTSSPAVELPTVATGVQLVTSRVKTTLYWPSFGRVDVVPGVPVTPVDTVGAGDSFNAGFLAGHLGGADLHTSLRLAAVCGALSTRAAGGTAAQPALAEARTEMSGG